jgi:hypothetical protein
MRRLFSLAISLAPLSAAAQLPSDDWFSPCEGPITTCIAPRISQQAEHVSAAFWEPTKVPPDSVSGGEGARDILERWQAAARVHLPVTEAERLRMRYALPDRTGQELALITELQGPVDAADLARRYDWSVSDTLDGVALTAVPRDQLERLFYSRFIVTLEGTTYRPIALQILPPGGLPGVAVALHPWIDPNESDIHLVSVEQGRAALVRTAEASSNLSSDDTVGTLRGRSPMPPRRLPQGIAPRVVAPGEPIEARKP